LKIIIAREDDRLEVAKILVKNGYTVRTGKRLRPGSKTAWEHYVETVEDEKV
jgi:hypothetical protein